jgi:hypothetical protein
VRRAVLLLLLATLVAPAGAAQACDIVQLETLETALPPAPAVVGAGRTLSLPVRITRAGTPAAGVEVFASLDGPGFGAYRSGVTGSDGSVVLRLDVPRTARGPAELDVEAYRPVVDLPCAAVEEYDRNAHPWGRVR